MKKIISLVIAMVMMFAVAAYAEESSEITGSWYLSQVIISGTAYSNVAQIGLNMKVELSEDGTGVITMNEGNPSACAWKKNDDGTYSFMEESAQQEIKMNVDENGSMILGADNENCYIFSREQYKAVDFAKVKAANTAEEFNGSYAITYVSADGYTLPVENAMEDLKVIGLATTGVEIKDNTVALFGQEAKEFSFVNDGTMYLDTNDGLDMTNVKIYLLEDGGLAINWLGLTLYAGRIE